MGVTDSKTKHLLFMCEDIIESLPSLERNNGIPHTIGSTSAFRVAGVATPDVPSCSGVWV